MTYTEIKGLTLDQAKAELEGSKPASRTRPEDEQVVKQRELLDSLCFRNRLTPQQLSQMDPSEVSVMLRDIDRRLMFELPTLKAIITAFAKHKSIKAS